MVHVLNECAFLSHSQSFGDVTIETTFFNKKEEVVYVNICLSCVTFLSFGAKNVIESVK